MSRKKQSRSEYVSELLKAEWIRRGRPVLDRATRREIAVACNQYPNAHAIAGRWGYLAPVEGHPDLRRWP